jgi:hypothetical protein
MLEMLTFVMRRDRIAQTSTWILSGIVILLCSTNRYEIEASGGAVDPANVPPGAEVVLLSFEVEKYDTRARDAQWNLSKNLQLISGIGLDTVEGVTLALSYRWE